jgi:hypothetical protein
MDMIAWLKTHKNIFGYGLLLAIILVLGINYADLRNQKSVSIDATNQEPVQEEIPVAPAPVVEEPTVDTILPKIQNFCLSRNEDLKKFEELVCIRIDSWNGYLNSTNSIPITGIVKGELKSITVDGKKITWDENNQIYQRINLYIYGGLNKYKVVVEDMAGNIATGYVQTDAENTDNDYDVNLNE